jgi:MFS family permease
LKVSDGAEGSALTRNVLVLGTTSMFSTFCLSLFTGYLGVYLLGLGYTKAEVGLLYSLGAIAVVASYMVSGWVADRFGRKNAIVAASLILVGAVTLLGFHPGGLVALGIFLLNWGTGALQPAFSAMITESVSVSKRGSALGIFNSLAVGLGAVAVLVSGSFVNGSDTAAYAERLPFLLLLSAVIIMAVTVAREAFLLETYTQRKPYPLKSAIRRIFKPLTEQKIKPLTIAYMIHDAGLSFVLYLIPIYAVLFLHANSVVLASMLALNYLMTLLLQTLFGRLADRWKRTKVILVSFFVEAFAIGSVVLVRSVLFLVLVYGIWVAVGQMDNPAQGALLADLTEKSTRSSVMGGFGGLTTLAAVPAPAVGGLLLSLKTGFAGGYGLPFYVAFVLLLYSALLIFFYRFQTYSG